MRLHGCLFKFLGLRYDPLVTRVIYFSMDTCLPDRCLRIYIHSCLETFKQI